MPSSEVLVGPDQDATEDSSVLTRIPVMENEAESRAFADAVLRAMTRAVKDAIADHHRVGNPVPIGRNGHIVMLYPDGSERPLESEQ